MTYTPNCSSSSSPFARMSLIPSFHGHPLSLSNCSVTSLYSPSVLQHSLRHPLLCLGTHFWISLSHSRSLDVHPSVSSRSDPHSTTSPSFDLHYRTCTRTRAILITSLRLRRAHFLPATPREYVRRTDCYLYVLFIYLVANVTVLLNTWLQYRTVWYHILPF